MDKQNTFWDDLLSSMRPKHWVKNVFVFAALVFSYNLVAPIAIAKTVAAFAIFCLLSGASYIFDDLIDRGHDIHHPVKKLRPIVAGRISAPFALLGVFAIDLICLGAAWLLGKEFFYTTSTFIAVRFLYSLWLKKIAIIDAFAIAAGYVLRMVAGAVAIAVPISAWLLICTLLLSLFLGLTKRSLELKLLHEAAADQRPSLANYNPYLIDRMVAVISAAILITYTLYTLAPETVNKFNGHGLTLTVPVVLYGIFRYLYLVHQKQIKTTIEAELVADRPLMITAGLYVLVTFAAVYF